MRGLEENVRQVKGTSQMGRGGEVGGGDGDGNFRRAGEGDEVGRGNVRWDVREG